MSSIPLRIMTRFSTRKVTKKNLSQSQIGKDRQKIIQLLKIPILEANPEDYKEYDFEDIISDETSKENNYL